MTLGGEPVSLSTMEYRILACFLQHEGEVLSREQFLDEVRGHDSSVYSETKVIPVLSLIHISEPTRPY